MRDTHACFIAPSQPWSTALAGLLLEGARPFSGSEGRIDRILIIDAFWRDGYPMGMGNIWLLWLNHKFPKAKALLLGHRPVAAKGYLPLYSYEQCVFADSAAIAEEISLWPNDGINGLDAFVLLTKGHGDKSLLKALGRLGNLLDITLVLAEEEGGIAGVWAMQRPLLLKAVAEAQEHWVEYQELIAVSPLGSWKWQLEEKLAALEQTAKNSMPTMDGVADMQQLITAGVRELTQWQQWLSEI